MSNAPPPPEYDPTRPQPGPPPPPGEWGPGAPPPPAPGWDPALTAPQWDPASAPPPGNQWGQASPVQAPGYGYGPQNPAQNDPRKSKIVAGLLAILVAGLGIHNFYLGYTGKGIAQLVLTLTCIGYPISLIWSIVEGIRILTGGIATDASGIPLKD